MGSFHEVDHKGCSKVETACCLHPADHCAEPADVQLSLPHVCPFATKKNAVQSGPPTTQIGFSRSMSTLTLALHVRSLRSQSSVPRLSTQTGRSPRFSARLVALIVENSYVTSTFYRPIGPGLIPLLLHFAVLAFADRRCWRVHSRTRCSMHFFPLVSAFEFYPPHLGVTLPLDLFRCVSISILCDALRASVLFLALSPQSHSAAPQLVRPSATSASAALVVGFFHPCLLGTSACTSLSRRT